MMRPGLRWQLGAVFVAAVVVVTIITTALGVQEASSNLRSTVLRQQQENGLNAAKGADYVLEAAKRSLISSADLIPLSDLRPQVNAEAIGPMLDPLPAYSQAFQYAYLLDRSGRPVLARPISAPLHGLSFGDDPAFLQAVETGAPALALEPGVGHSYWVTVVQQTRNDPEPYYLLGTLNGQRLEELLASTVERGDDAMLVTAGGLVLAATRESLAQGPLNSWMPWKQLEGGKESAEGQPPAGGGNVVVTRSNLPNYPGSSVILLSPQSEIIRLERELVRNAVINSVALSATAGLLGILAASRITAPLRDVRSAAHRMRQGDLAVRAKPTGPPETRQLAHDFNAMADALARDREALLQLQVSLEQRVQQRTADLHRKQEEMELFFYGVSHDFKSPVISIASFAQLAQESIRNPKTDRREIEEHMERIRQSSLTLQTLIAELLKFAKAERMSPAYERVDLSEVVGNVVAELRPLARERGVRVERLGLPLPVVTDPESLRHILTNLLENAIKYMPSKRGALVAVSWERRGDRFALCVQDNGMGIPKAVQARLFRPFSRHQPRGVSATGTGLGLSIVNRLVEKLNGTVQLESAEQVGTLVTVLLPAEPPSGVAG